MARSSLPDSVAADVTRLLFSERLSIAQIAPLASQIEAPSTTKGAALPVHPATAAYLDDEEKSFFDRYSDFIYIGAMLLASSARGSLRSPAACLPHAIPSSTACSSACWKFSRPRVPPTARKR